MSPERDIMGWDLGGAHLKMAWLDSDARLVRVGEWATPLWQGLEHLDRVLDRLAGEFPLADCEHRLTMTGELVDLFEDRAQGVAELAAHMAGRLPQGRLQIYAGPQGFVAPKLAARHSPQVASANWHATLSWLAGRVPRGILVDVGSTTSDLLPFANGKPVNRAYSDRERLAGDELLYTGVVRTPVMAVARRVPFAGDWLTLANEHFATMADVYRILGQLPEQADLYPSADGQDKTPAASIRRLARMIGADATEASEEQWIQLAAFLSDRQLDALSLACQRHFSMGMPAEAPLVGAGAGGFLVRRLAQRLGRDYIAFDSLFPELPSGDPEPAVCAPAVAVAALTASEMQS